MPSWEPALSRVEGKGLGREKIRAGVRAARNGPLRWVSAGPVLSIQPGDFVVVGDGSPEALANVIVAPNQLLEASPALVPSAQITRIATEADLLRLGRESAPALDEITAGVRLTSGLPPNWSDWIVPPGSPPELCRALAPDSCASHFVARVFRKE